MSGPDATDRQAFELFSAGKKHEAYLLLKREKNTPLKEAVAMMQTMQDDIVKGDGASADLVEAAKEAFDAVDTFDEMTMLVLRDLRDNKEFRSPQRAMNAQRAAKECAAIYDAIRALIDSDINPTTAFRAYVLRSVDGVPTEELVQKNITMMQEVLDSHTLHEDLLKLL